MGYESLDHYGAVLWPVNPCNFLPQIFTAIDLFSLYVLFSHFRPCDATQGNSLFQMSSLNACANVRITTKKKRKENSHEGIMWSEMGKQNVYAKRVY